MPQHLTPLPILPPPGVVLTESERAIEGRWEQALNVRFVKGRPQKLGGNARATATATSGVPRSLHAWRDNAQNNYLAAGTYRKLYVFDSSFLINDVTPYRAQGTFPNNPFTVTNGSNLVAVAQSNHGASPGDTVEIANAALVGGLDPNGVYVIEGVQSSGSYTYRAATNATAGATGGGAAATYKYEVPVGGEVGVYGLGYGVGPYGMGTYGTARDSSTIVVEPRIWSLDHFGKLLIASYNGGSIYMFDPSVNQPWPRAVILSNDAGLPTNCRFVFVTPERFIFALRENMQVSWCSQGDPSTWTVATNNTANTRTLTEGTKLVAGRVLSDFISLVWTDAALYRFQYTGSTYVYNSSMIAKDCGLISPGAVVTAGGVAYWMGQDTFWMYSGSVQPMPNVEDIRKFVFDNLRFEYGYQCTAVFNPQHNEIWFFYTEVGKSSPSAGVIFSIENQCWAPIKFGRTAGTHFTQGDTRPYMAAADGFVYQHENTNDDNGAIMPWSLSIASYALNEGGDRVEVVGLVPDFKDQVGNITMTVSTMDRMNDSAVEDTETEIIAPKDTGMIDLRLSGRYVGMLLSGASLGSYFRLGKPVAWVQAAGSRR